MTVRSVIEMGGYRVLCGPTERTEPATFFAGSTGPLYELPAPNELDSIFPSPVARTVGASLVSREASVTLPANEEIGEQ